MKLNQAANKFRKFFRLHKRMPSYSEICALFGFASKKASYYLAQKLIKAGILEKDGQGKLVPKNLLPPLPLLGSIPAGFPSYAEGQVLDTIFLDQYFTHHPEKTYILKVTGDSMIEAGILPNDLILVEKNQEPKQGDIVVAFIDNEFTLKYFRKINNKVCLIPANKKYPPFYPKEKLEIFGKVGFVIRKYK